jgi:G3E family GTPase
MRARLQPFPRARSAGAADMSDLIPTTALSNFLSAGTTTLLNRLVKHPQFANTAGLDRLLVERLQDEVVQVNAACLCCTVRDDLVDALRALFLQPARAEIPRFEQLTIEITGLADPAPVLHMLKSDPLIGSRNRLHGVATLVDAVNGAALDAPPEAVKHTAAADRSVLTELDLTSSSRTVALRETLRHLNPGALIVSARHGIISRKLLLDLGPFRPDAKIGEVLGWPNEEAYSKYYDNQDDLLGHHEHKCDDHHDPDRHDARNQAFCLAFGDPLLWKGTRSFLAMPVATHGENLPRVRTIPWSYTASATPFTSRRCWTNGRTDTVGGPAWFSYA